MTAAELTRCRACPNATRPEHCGYPHLAGDPDSRGEGCLLEPPPAPAAIDNGGPVAPPQQFRSHSRPPIGGNGIVLPFKTLGEALANSPDEPDWIVAGMVARRS